MFGKKSQPWPMALAYNISHSALGSSTRSKSACTQTGHKVCSCTKTRVSCFLKVSKCEKILVSIHPSKNNINNYRCNKQTSLKLAISCKKKPMFYIF